MMMMMRVSRWNWEFVDDEDILENGEDWRRRVVSWSCRSCSRRWWSGLRSGGGGLGFGRNSTMDLSFTIKF